jgi:hypothetical protein
LNHNEVCLLPLRGGSSRDALIPFKPFTGKYDEDEVGVTFRPKVPQRYTIPEAIISVLVANSSYFSKPLQNALHNTVILFQQNANFKLGFSQALVLLYPYICALYNSGVGTENETILVTSVQVLTAPSIVLALSMQGMFSNEDALVRSSDVRVNEKESRESTVTFILTCTVLEAFQREGCDDDATAINKLRLLESFPVVKNRISQPLRDLIHVSSTGESAFCLFHESIQAGNTSPVGDIYYYSILK